MDNSTEELAPIARREGLIIRELAEEVLVYDEQTNTAHSLSPTAAFVWRRCDGQTSVAEIAALLQEQSPSVTVQTHSVWMALEELEKSNLLDEQAVRIERAAGISRRGVLKLGIAVAAVPLIASLVTPVVAAVSTCPMGSTCCPLSPGPGFCIAHSSFGCATAADCCACKGGTMGRTSCPDSHGVCSNGGTADTPCCQTTGKCGHIKISDGTCVG